MILITNFFYDYTKCEKKIDLRKNFKRHKSSEIDYIKKIISWIHFYFVTCKAKSFHFQVKKKASRNWGLWVFSLVILIRPLPLIWIVGFQNSMPHIGLIGFIYILTEWPWYKATWEHLPAADTWTSRCCCLYSRYTCTSPSASTAPSASSWGSL